MHISEYVLYSHNLKFEIALMSFCKLAFWSQWKTFVLFILCFVRLFWGTIIGFPTKMSSLEPLTLEMDCRCWARNRRPTSPSSVRPGLSGWLLHRRVLCITSSVRMDPLFKIMFLLCPFVFETSLYEALAVLELWGLQADLRLRDPPLSTCRVLAVELFAPHLTLK